MSLEDQDRKDLQVARRVVTNLFVNGQGRQAERLVLTSADGKDLGGWCKRAVVDVITKVLEGVTMSGTGSERRKKIAMIKASKIRAGCIVTDRLGRLGFVEYAPYTVALCNVYWGRRLNHDICKTENLTLLLTKKQASAVRKLVWSHQ